MPIDPEIQEMVDEVANTATVIDSAITLITSFADLFERVAGDKAATLEAVAALRAKKQALADAVAAVPPA